MNQDTCAYHGCYKPTVTEYHCGRCHETFATLTLFEDHRPGIGLICKPPADGLVQDKNGVWHTPEGLANNERKAAQLSALKGSSRER